jgi:aminomethyltransferase
MPISYSGIIDEHIAVRTKAGFFDVSHMGEILVKGVDAANWLNNLTPNDITNLNPGKAQYSMFLNERGGVIDDIIIYMLSVDEFLIVVNAANITKDFNWLQSHRSGSVKIHDVSEKYGLVAVAGPLARKLLSHIIPPENLPNNSFHFKRALYRDYEVLVSATGYTGEKTTFEIFLPAEATSDFLEALYEIGERDGIKPCGLGARDSLRIEACLPLYGNELTEDRTPFESDLGWVVKMKKPSDFIGKKALMQKLQSGYEKQIGYFIAEEGSPIPRTGYTVYSDSGAEIGEVTSGTFSPMLKKPVFMAFVIKDYTEEGKEVLLDARGKKIKATAVRKPFTEHIEKKEV